MCVYVCVYVCVCVCECRRVRVCVWYYEDTSFQRSLDA